MAEESKKVLINVQVNVEEAIKNMAKAQTEIKNLRSQNKELSKNYVQNSEVIAANNIQIKNLSSTVNSNQKIALANTATVNNSTGAYKKLELQYAVASQRAKDLAASNTASSKEIKKAADEANKLNEKLKSIDKTVGQSVRGIVEYERGIGKIGKHFLGMIGVSAIIGGIAAAFRNAFGIIKQFDQEMANVNAITNASKEELNKLRDIAISLGGSTKFTASEVAGLETELGKLGFTTQQIIAATKGITLAAAATGESLQTTATIVGSVTMAFGLNASETQRVADVMAKSFSTSALDLSNFSESIKYVAPIAKQAGVSVEETAALLGVLANNGIKGSMAGTSLRKVFTDLIGTGGNLQDKIIGLTKDGLNLADAKDEVGRTAMTTLMVLKDNIKTIPELTKIYQGAAGAAQEMADKQLNTVQGRITILKSTWEGFILSVENGQGRFSTAIKDMIVGLTDSISGFRKLIMTEEELSLDSQKNIVNNRIESFEKYLSQEKDKEKYINQEIQSEKNLVKTKKNAINELSEQIKKNEEWVESTENYLKTTRDVEFERRKNLTSTKQEIESNKEKLKSLKQQISGSNAYINALGGVRKAKKDENKLSMQVAENVEQNQKNKEKLDKKALKRLEAISKAELNIENLKSQTIIDKQNVIANNEKKSFNDRKAALEKSESEQIKIIERNRDLELKNKELTELERNSITEKAAFDIAKIKSDADKSITDIEAKEIDKRLKLEADALKAKKQQLANKQALDLEDLSKEYANSLKKAKYASDVVAINEKYEKDKLAIAQKYREQDFNESITALKAQLDLLPADADARIEIEKAIADAKATYAKESADIAIKANEDIANSHEESVKKQLELEQQLKDKKAELFSQLQTTIQDITNGVFERKNQELDEETARITSEYDKQIAAAEGNEKKQNDIESKKAARLEEQEAQKRKLIREQAIVERAFQTFSIGVDTTRSVGEIQLNAATLASNPITAALAPLALAQIPVAIGIGALQLASIMAAPLPKAQYGKVFKGRSHAQGGIPVEVEGDEMILTKGVYRNPVLREIASMINQAAGGVSLGAATNNNYLATGGVLSNAMFKNDGGYVYRNYSDSGLTEDKIERAMEKAVAKIKVLATIEDIRKADENYTIIEDRGSY